MEELETVIAMAMIHILPRDNTSNKSENISLLFFIGAQTGAKNIQYRATPYKHWIIEGFLRASKPNC